MTKAREYPPMTVVPGDGSSIHRHAAQLLAAEQRIAVPSRAPDRRVSDGYYGLGAGPPGSGEAPPNVHQPGGELLLGIQHPAFKTTERLYRAIADVAWYNPRLSPTRPFIFEIGAFKVPKNSQLWLTDYSFAVLRLSGIDAGDFVYAEDGRFSGSLGFDIAINKLTRPNDIAYELDPSPIATEPPTFNRPSTFEPFSGAVAASVSEFSAAAFQSFGATAGPGSSLMPVRGSVMGDPDAPFTLVIEEDQTVGFACCIFKPLSSPVAGVQARFGGYLIQQTMAEALLNRMRPA